VVCVIGKCVGGWEGGGGGWGGGGGRVEFSQGHAGASQPPAAFPGSLSPHSNRGGPGIIIAQEERTSLCAATTLDCLGL